MTSLFSWVKQDLQGDGNGDLERRRPDHCNCKAIPGRLPVAEWRPSSLYCKRPTSQPQNPSQSCSWLRTLLAGRINIAKSIVNADENTSRKSRNSRLEELARHVFTNLLVPCTHNLLSSTSLTVVQAKGGTTRQASERSSPPSGYELEPDEFETVNRRTGNRKKVLSLGTGQVDHRSCGDATTLAQWQISKMTVIQVLQKASDHSLLSVHISSLIILAKKRKTPKTYEQLFANANIQIKQKGRTWALLNQFSGLELHGMLSGPLIDSVENVFALQHDHHKAFGEMRLWFTESEVQSTPHRTTTLDYDTYLV